MPMSCSLKVQAESSCTERNPIGHRTQSDRTPNAIRSDTERDPIGHRTPPVEKKEQLRRKFNTCY